MFCPWTKVEVCINKTLVHEREQYYEHHLAPGLGPRDGTPGWPQSWAPGLVGRFRTILILFFSETLQYILKSGISVYWTDASDHSASLEDIQSSEKSHT